MVAKMKLRSTDFHATIKKLNRALWRALRARRWSSKRSPPIIPSAIAVRSKHPHLSVLSSISHQISLFCRFSEFFTEVIDMQ